MPTTPSSWPFVPFVEGIQFTDSESEPFHPPKPADPEPAPVFGFGAPSEEQAADGTTPFPHGFGDPSNNNDQATTSAFMAFGSPSGGYTTPSILLHTTPDGWYPDDGGYILTLAGPWSGVPKWRVKVRNSITGDIYPNDPTKPMTGMRSNKPGVGTDLPVSPDGFLRFSVCPLPEGLYDILVYYGPSYSAPYEILDAFEVVYRNYAASQWSIRNKLPQHWHGAGPRALVVEPRPENAKTWPKRLIESLTRAAAEECQDFGGAAITRLTQDLAEDAATVYVETTLGFPSSGRIYVGSRIYNYTGKTETTFTGCQPDRLYDVVALPYDTLVMSDPYSWSPDAA